ncbi:MAG: prolyl oligopeptidase family serine peptidase [Clostridiales bacterium]|nr:prolyl oligopeptidase family serine peptidase [Clostridiales bacterium]
MKKKFTAHDLWRFSYLSWPQLSEDGRFAAVVIKKPDGDGVCRPRVRVIRTDTGDTVYETPGGRHESMPRFLPGGVLALLSDESGENQVWTQENGKRTQRTFLRHGVKYYDAAGGVIAFDAVLWPGEAEAGTAFTEMTTEEKKAWQAETDLQPYVAEDLTYKSDEWFGMRRGERHMVGLYRGRDARLIMPDTECVYPALSADGRSAAFFAYPEKGARGREPRLMLWHDGDEKPAPLAPDIRFSAEQAPVFSRDAGFLWAPALERFENGFSPALVRLDLSENAAAVFFPDLSDEDTVGGVNETVISRTENGQNASCFSVLGDRVIFMTGWRGRAGLYSVPLEGERKASPLPYDNVTGFCADARGDLAVLSGTGSAPADLYLNFRRLTDEHRWLEEYEMPETEEFHIPSRDGKAELQYFLTYPAGFQKGRACPAVLDVKGGPETMYCPAYWHEFHALAAAGFAVIHGNPRGSAGFGRAFRADGICWRDEVMLDLEDMCLDAVERGVADRERIGVTGGSYGGYMTVKLISRTSFFAAAAGQRVLSNPGTSYGTGDTGWVSSSGDIPPHFSMLRFLQDRARGSSASRVDQIRVPLLLLHGYRDYRCTFEQSEQLFIPLKERHPEVPVRLVMFPEENHALTRTGNMKAQERHLKEIVDWFVRYLYGKEEEQNEKTGHDR